MREFGGPFKRILELRVIQMTVGGAYILFVELLESVHVEVGSLGVIQFSPGLYAYVGSARRGLEARVLRHLRRDKRTRWHIDYITPYAARAWATVIPADNPPECAISQYLLRVAKKVVKGFGASDCSCPSHMVYLGESSIRRTRNAGTSCSSLP